MKDETVTLLLGLGLLASLVLITFFLRTRSTYVSFTRDSEGRVIEIVERVL